MDLFLFKQNLCIGDINVYVYLIQSHGGKLEIALGQFTAQTWRAFPYIIRIIPIKLILRLMYYERLTTMESIV